MNLFDNITYLDSLATPPISLVLILIHSDPKTQVYLIHLDF